MPLYGDPQRQLIHEHADQITDLRPIAPMQRGADDEVALAAVSMEGGGEGREHGHEQRGTFGACERHHCREGGQVYRTRGDATGETGHGSAGAVGWEVERLGRAGEAFAPELRTFGEAVRRPVFAFVESVGAIGGAQRRRSLIGVAVGEVPIEMLEGDTIDRDVVQRRDEIVCRGAATNERRADRQVVDQIERATLRIANDVGHGGGLRRWIEMGEVDHRQRNRRLALHLDRTARVPVADEAVQGLVTTNDLRECAFESGDVERTVDAQDRRQVVRR